MVSFPGYLITEKLFEGNHSLIYRARRENDDLPVILKVLKKEYPLPEDISKFRWEYNTTKSLNMEGIIRVHGLERNGNSLVIIFEDFGGISLSSKLPLVEPGLKLFFHIACRTAEILDWVHQQNIVHKDINPTNITWNPETHEIKLIDFGISTILPRESLMNLNLNVLEGTLAYMSPEQTGRMNRGLDYRTDLYSLGVTFYEMLTGQLPFEGNDYLELVHYHIAKTPVPPHQINPDIPEMLSRIVLKLMAKTAEDRYQSAHGLKRDLEICRKQWEKEGKIALFPTAEHDVFYQLRIPQKLYGRKNEIAQLMTSFDQAAAGESQIILITGYSGIGKSALVNELRRPITEKNGFFISGKFDQYQQKIPFSAIIKALKTLIQQCLTQSDDSISIWKDKILDRVGKNGQIIIDSIPELELIVGQQPRVPELGPTESQNRFNMVFQNFISAFTDKEHPLVLFLDDLQWMDSASLGIIKTLVTNPDGQYFLLIGAYRDNEMDASHPLVITLDDIGKIRPIQKLTLNPLTPDDIRKLVSESIHHTPEICAPLAKLTAEKTGGNPFFINEFLKNLFREHLLYINKNGEWQWDFEKISEQHITDNVIELLAKQIMELSLETRHILKLAACIGNEFRLDTLGIIFDQTKEDTIKALWSAVEKGLLVVSEGFDQLNDLANHDIDAFEKIDLGVARFRHDRIHQAAYSLISDGEKEKLHLKIGWLLLENTGSEELENKVFNIVGQLNKGRALIEDEGDRFRLAELNFIAGKKAKKATAYVTAAEHFSLTPWFLNENGWKENYPLMLDSKLALAEVLYLSGEFDTAEQVYADLLKQANSTMDKVRVHIVEMTQYHLQGRLNDALHAQLTGLTLLGLNIPDGDDAGLVPFLGAELEKISRLLGDRKFEQLLDAPDMTDESAMAMMNILAVMWITVYVSGDKPNLMTWVCAKMTTLSLEYGNCELSSVAYVNYGLLLSSFMGNCDLGYQAGKVAIDLCERYDNLAIRCQVYCIFYNLVNHWKQPISQKLEQYQKAYEYGMQSGEFCYASYALEFLILHPFVSGSKNLGELHEDAIKYDKIIKKISPASLVYSDPLIGHISNLRGLTNDTATLNWKHFDEEAHTGLYSDNPLIMCWMYCARLEVLYLYGYYDKALALLDQADLMASTRPGQVVIPQIYFYTCLNLVKCWATADEADQKRYMAIIDTFQEKMKAWSEQCEANHTHKYLLVEAERLAVLGHGNQAADLYDKAIDSALKHGFINNAALANEIAGQFWLERGKEKFAGLYMTQAFHLYQQWGASAKVKNLEEKYSGLLAKPIQQSGYKNSEHMITTTITTTDGSHLSLDLNSVMKASQAISQEIVFNNLLETMVKIVIENAGAQKGLIVLEMDGSLKIAASGHIDAVKPKVMQAVAIEGSGEVPVSLIQYVARTKESIVLDNAAAHDGFSSDIYIKTHQPKSILCAPILNKGELSGVLYLENNLTTSAFTPDRLELLNILSAQTAISIENARLYQDLDTYNQTLEQRVLERTEKLNQALEKVEVSNRKIMDSITYAKRIQNSLLPNREKINQLLMHNVILWKPRDIVGGDIFNVEPVDGGFLIAMMDCTGHGVPGAFMSMIASSLLKRLIRSVDPRDPAELLMLLNKGVRDSLRHDQRETISDDGLDAAICYVNPGEKRLVFAGAKLSLIYTEQSQAIRIKGDRQSIGYQTSDPDFKYSNHKISIKKGMRFYLCTDGFTDQMGGEKGIRFGIRRLLKLLTQMAKTPLEDQEELLFQAFETYRGSKILQDDLTVLGFALD